MSPRLGGTRGIAHFICGPRAKWAIVLLWLVIIVVAAPAAQKLTGAQKNDNASWLPASAESTKVIEQTADFRPDTIPAVVIHTRAGGLTAQDRERIAAETADLKALTDHGVDGARTQGPQVDRRQDPRATQTLVPIVIDESGWMSLSKAVEDIEDVVVRGDGLNTYITGPGGIAADSAEAFEGIDGTLLYAALTVVIIILLFTYRSPTLLLVPVFSVVGALFSAQAVVYLLATHADLVVNGQSAGILTVLVFGAGTDYALLLVARYREELRRHEDRHEAMGLALHRAGPAIIASAATVGVGMLCLLVADMNSTSGLGPVAAVGIAVGMLAMLTLFPALLVIFGRWIFWPTVPHMGSREPTESGAWARIGNRVARRPRVVWVTTAVILAALSFGLMALRADGLTNAETFTDKPDSVTGQEVQARYFPAGGGDPMVIIARADAAAQVVDTVESVDGIVPGSVGPPPGVPTERNGYVYLEATLTDRADSPAAERTLDQARDRLHAIEGAEAQVGGSTAIKVDADNAAARDRNLVIPLILIVVLVILALLLRAVVAPLVLITTVVLSFAAALGISALAFRHVFDFAGEDASFPLFVFVFLVALGIDYNIFLMTRVREESVKLGTRRGTLTGLAATGGVISSAGLVLAGTFAALATLPIVGFAEIGFAVALGVLLDTFVVRSVLVCALALDLDRHMWWPNHLKGDSESQAPRDSRAAADAASKTRGRPGQTSQEPAPKQAEP